MGEGRARGKRRMGDLDLKSWGRGMMGRDGRNTEGTTKSDGFDHLPPPARLLDSTHPARPALLLLADPPSPDQNHEKKSQRGKNVGLIACLHGISGDEGGNGVSGRLLRAPVDPRTSAADKPLRHEGRKTRLTSSSTPSPSTRSAACPSCTSWRSREREGRPGSGPSASSKSRGALSETRSVWSRT